MKQKENPVFSKQLLDDFIDRSFLSGLTKEALVVFLSELVTRLSKNIFLEFETNDEAFSFYRSAVEYNEKSFLFYPESLPGVSVPGFRTEEARFQKESVVGLVSEIGVCCVGTGVSFSEKKTSQNIKKEIKKTSFSVGENIDISDVLTFLIKSGYQKSDLVYEPGYYSNRGDVLDVFPDHFKKPFRLSFDFDCIESISSFDVSSQLTDKNHKKITLKEFFKNIEVVDKNELKVVFGEYPVYGFSNNSGVLSLLGGQENLLNATFLSIEKSFGLGLGFEKKYDSETRLFFASSENKRLKKYALKKDCENIGFLKTGFYLKETKTLVFSALDLVEKENKLGFKEKNKNIDMDVLDRNSITTLQIGEYIVHRSFGVGIFNGLVFKDEIGRSGESIEIGYGDGARVFVSLDQLSLVHRYIGTKKEPRVSTLGSKRWKNELLKTKKAVNLFAKELISLYTEKNNKRPFRYLEDNDLDGALSDSFSFVETQDQMKAINDVYDDMNSEKPMDRLICGDVGFGKTEVAIRAVFKSCLSKKVSVLLCPTTILADQHYITCKERLSPLGVTIGLLSRFRSKKEQSETLKDLVNNKIDVLVGTHRLLSSDVKIPNLGLLIVDEEHRFGVRHKEKIREFKTHLDILTLTATPIPRTLQQSLVGLRSLSTILTPPKSRKPIFTSVRYFDWELIFSNIKAEVDRGGQVYFLHNDIKSIPIIINKIKNKFDSVVVEGVNGKMASRELEPVVLSFFSGEIDILVCTTIIESGLDITNANTIIINNAQDFGLSQLYQIRGRVGRGKKQAHCLLLVPQKPLSQNAHQRLKAVEQNNALGSGYNISLEDLEIRGAGSLFGYKQSGNISMVGFELYCEILKDEVDKIKTGDSKKIVPVVFLDTVAEIDETYIKSRSVRVDFYFQLSRVKTKEDILFLREGVVDRFGPIPKEFNFLLNVALIKIAFRGSCIIKIKIMDSGLFLTLGGLGLFNKIEDLFDSVSSFKNENILNHHYEKDKENNLVVVFSTKNLETSFHLLFECEDLFTKKNE